MSTTGWTGAQAPAETPAMPLTEQLLHNRERGAGDTLAVALGRSQAAEAREARDEAAGARDPDEVAAGMVNRGYSPGLSGERALRCRELEDLLQTEYAKIKKGDEATERVRGLLARGQIGALEAHERMSGDFGDVKQAEKLEGQLARARELLAEAQSMIAPPQERLDPLAEAGRHAHELFVQITRAKLAEVAAAPPEPRPFAGRSAIATLNEDDHFSGSLWNTGQEIRRGNLGPAGSCGHCEGLGVTPAERERIHAGAL